MSQTAHTVNLPSGIAAGHLLLVFFSNDGAAEADVTTPASGWTKVRSALAASSAMRLTVFARLADGAEAATITVTTAASEGSSYIAHRVTGVFGTDVASSLEATTVASGTSTAPNSGSLNPAGWDAEDAVWYSVFGNDADSGVTTYPTNYPDNNLFSEWASVNGCGVGVATRNLNAASEDPGVYALSASEEWAAFTIAVRPAGVGAIAGASAGVATVTGTLRGKGALAGASAGVAAATGTLQAKGALSGATAGTATATGTLGAKGALIGSSAGIAAVTGTLQAKGSLVGASAGVASATGTIGARGSLAGSSAGVAAVTGTLRGTGALAGSTAGVSTASATLTNATPQGLAGIAAGAATASGTLTGRGSLAGATAGLGTASGTLTNSTPVGLAGIATGSSTVSGTLTARGSLAGSAAGIATVTATIRGVGKLVGTASGTGTASGALKGRGYLSGLSAGVGSATGTMRARGALAGLAAGVATVTGSLVDVNAVVYGPTRLTGITLTTPRFVATVSAPWVDAVDLDVPELVGVSLDPAE